MNLWAKLHKYLPIVGILLFIFIIWKTGFDEILTSLSQVKIIYLILFILMFLPTILIQIFKWYYIVKLQGIRMGFFEAFKFHVVSTFLGSITPGRIGLLSKIFFLKKNSNRPVGECASSVILDKLFDLILLFVFGFIGSLFLLENYNLELLIGIFLSLFIISAFLLFNKKITKFLLKRFYNYFIPNKFKERVALTFNHFYENIPSIRKLSFPILITLLTWLLLYTQSYFLALGFNIKISYIHFVFIMSIVTLATLIPITIFGAGIREFSLIALFSSFNLKTSNLIAFSICSAFISQLLFFVGYIIYIKKVNLGQKDEQIN